MNRPRPRPGWRMVASLPTVVDEGAHQTFEGTAVGEDDGGATRHDRRQRRPLGRPRRRRRVATRGADVRLRGAGQSCSRGRALLLLTGAADHDERVYRMRKAQQHLRARGERHYRERMDRPRLTYFDAPVSRGEECRVALHVAGVDFEDRRLKRDEWAAFKASTPFGVVPILDMPGHPTLADSTAILVFIGRRHGLHPKDDFEAARHEAVMSYVEELRANVGLTIRMTDAEEKKAARERLATTYLQTWGANVEKQIGGGPFFAGSSIHVVDVRLHNTVRWFRGGALDHIPTTVLAAFPKLNRLFEAVDEHPRVKEWYAKS